METTILAINIKFLYRFNLGKQYSTSNEANGSNINIKANHIGPVIGVIPVIVFLSKFISDAPNATSGFKNTKKLIIIILQYLVGRDIPLTPIFIIDCRFFNLIFHK